MAVVIFCVGTGRAEAGGGRGGVLVVGMDSLLTNLARCCRPAPPDAISGFVTRGRGVAVHRRDCSNLRHMAQSSPGRVIDVEWGRPGAERAPLYPLDVVVEAADRHGLLRDIIAHVDQASAKPVGGRAGTAVIFQHQPLA